MTSSIKRVQGSTAPQWFLELQTQIKSLKSKGNNQKQGITTFIEIILNQELGEPFRRDAMKKPVKVAGISKEDMKPQKSVIN